MKLPDIDYKEISMEIIIMEAKKKIIWIFSLGNGCIQYV